MSTVKEIAEVIRRSLNEAIDDGDTSEEVEAMITRWLQTLRDAAIEECAAVCDRELQRYPDASNRTEYAEGGVIACVEIAAAIRALRSTP